MSRSLRTFSLALLFTPSLILVPCARAGFPPIGNPILPGCIRLVGSDGVQASPSGAFSVVVRDLANNPLPFVAVIVDLSGAPDLRLCGNQLDASLTLDCTNARVSALTDANGVARFTLLGGGYGPPFTIGFPAQIFCQGFLLGSVPVCSFDLDGQGGVSANDLSVWLAEFAAGTPYVRSDFDCSGDVGANDLSFWFGAFASGTQIGSCGTTCP